MRGVQGRAVDGGRSYIASRETKAVFDVSRVSRAKA